MRPGFRNTLMEYNETIVQRRDLPTDAYDQRRAVEQDQRDVLREEMEASKTPLDVQTEIFSIQERKQRIMQQLHAEIQRIEKDLPALERMGRDTRFIVQKKDGLFCRTISGRLIPVTLGDILTDHAWGLEYELDPRTVDRKTRKKVVIERARQKIQDLLDEQIKTEESRSGNNHEYLREAYSGSLADSKDKFRPPPFGILAEKILLQVAKKWVIDDGLGFKVEAGDAEYDIAKKIDFFITRVKDDRTRGVRIEEEHNLHAKGIQFTLRNDPETLAHKQQQIERSKRLLKREGNSPIDDLMLVTMQMAPISTAFNRWQRLGKPPGGPANLLSSETQREIFNELMKGLIDENEAEAFWQQAA